MTTPRMIDMKERSLFHIKPDDFLQWHTPSSFFLPRMVRSPTSLHGEPSSATLLF